MIIPDGSVTSSWSTHDAASGIAESAYSNALSNKRGQSTADLTSTALRSQTVSGQGSLMFPEAFNKEIDFGALHMDQSSSLFPFTSMEPSTTASTASNLDSSFARDVDCSSSGASSVLSDLTYAKPQPGTISGCRQDPSKGTETVCMDSRQSCLFSALEILQTLHIPPTACLCSTKETSTLVAKRQPRKTGSVLATNRTAVRRMSEILQCSCMSFSRVQLVFVIICDRLIAWYRAVLRNFSDNRQDAYTNADARASDDDNTFDTVTGMASERILHERFAVGEYSFDTRLESKVRAQVLASELHQLETVVAKLEDRLQKADLREVDPIPNHKKSQSTWTIDSPGLSNAVHARLTAHLHKQLQNIKAEIDVDN